MNAIALVVGNSNYSFETPSFVLKNPGNDARGIAEALTRLERDYLKLEQRVFL